MWQALLRFLSFRTLAAVSLEHFLIVLCVLDAESLRGAPVSVDAEHILKAVVVAIVLQVFLHLRDVYNLDHTLPRSRFFGRLGQALVLGASALLLLTYISPSLMPDRGVFVIVIVYLSIFLVLWHALLRFWVSVRTPRTNLLVIGTG